VALLLDQEDIREAIPFPKTKAAVDPLTGAPDFVSEEQLSELHIRLAGEPEASP
jgi:aspartyl-tRNA synthetase